VLPIVKACHVSTADIAGRGQQRELDNHQASLGKQQIAEIDEGALGEYLATTRPASLLPPWPIKVARAARSAIKAHPNPGTFES
jgi:hypothetical protein